MDLAPPPSPLDLDETLSPKGPWSFLRAALPGGFSGPGLGLILGWLLASLPPAFFLARHLVGLAGHSGMPVHWGERLDAKELMELWWNGEWRHQPLPAWALVFLLLGLGVALWSGWRMQADRLNREATFGPWFKGALEALLLGPLPLYLPVMVGIFILKIFGERGIDSFAWLLFIFRPLFWFAWSGACFLQWALLRVARLDPERGGWFKHLGHSFQRLWLHPLQWGALILGGSALRLFLHGTALAIGWRMGGATLGRVWMLVLLQLIAVAASAWTLGWVLRVAALFTVHDAYIRRERAALEAAVNQGAPVEA
ncbi:MAG TPA: hypothetical protein VJ505_08110 [Holophagaceae bacterium]|nr:hypothetical protein [Holophagaceae bacterium]